MRSDRPLEALAAIDWEAVLTWALCFGLVAFLGIDGGGYDALIYSQVGIAAWWVLLLGVAAGALPRTRLSPTALTALGLLAGFVIWTALSLNWTESLERTLADVARVLTYLSLFSLVLFVRAPREPRRVVAAVGTAIAVIALIGLLSRLHPAWFPSADQTAQLLTESRERLSYPLNYWNGLGALIAVGLPLLLNVAATARQPLFRALAAAAVPGMVLALVYTLSRAGIVAAVIAVAAYLALTDDRLPKLIGAAVAGAGSLVLVAVAVGDHALREGLANAEAVNQGNDLLLVAIVVSVAVGLLQLGVSVAMSERRRPAWTRPSRGFSLAAVGVAAVVVIVAFLAAGGPHRISHGIDEFKSGSDAGVGTGRLNSFSGESRYALWKSAVKEFEDEPILGTGSGTFEFWWDRTEGGEEAVHDAHSLYLQTLGELGIIGFLVLAGFVLTVLVGGALAAVRAGPATRAALAAATAGCLAFAVAAAADWTWQIPVLPLTFFCLAAVLVAAAGGGGQEAEGEPREERAPGLPLWLRLGLPLGALVAIVAIAIPFAQTDLVRQSEAAVREGNLDKALEDARSARNVEPGAASPRLQEALVLELGGDLDRAVAAARSASRRESTNWRPWLVISRLEAKRGDADAALAAYRRARSLYPLSPLFQE